MNMLAGLLSVGPCGLAARPPAWWDARARQRPGTGPPLGGGTGGDAAACFTWSGAWWSGQLQIG